MHFIKAILVAAMLLWAQSAEAHPHIFVRYYVKIDPGDAGYINLHFTFKVHEILSPLLTPGDTQLLAKDMMVNLQQHPFFLYLDMDGEALGSQTVRFTPIGNDGEDKLYSFDVSLPGSFQSFGFSLYDPQYFVSVQQVGADAVSTKVDKLTCTVQPQTVGKTAWGDIRTQYVQCTGKAAPKHLAPLIRKSMPEEMSPSGSGAHGERGMVP